MTTNFIGVGGGGSNILEYIQKSKLKGNYLIINNYLREYKQNKIHQIVFPLNVHKTINPTYLEEIFKNKILSLLNSKYKSVIFVSLGGFTGTNVLLKICESLSKFNSNIVIITTLPFKFEEQRRIKSEKIVSILQENQQIYIFDNEEFSHKIGRNLTLGNFFEKMNKEILDLIKNKF